MTTRRKTIKKPSFIITYAISFVLFFLVLGCIGLLIYNRAETLFQFENNQFRIRSELELQEKIVGHLTKEIVTGEDIVKVKELILSHYTDTAQYAQLAFSPISDQRFDEDHPIPLPKALCRDKAKSPLCFAGTIPAGCRPQK